MGSEENKEERGSPDDATLRLLNAKRLLELRRRVSASSTKEPAPAQSKATTLAPTDRQILIKALIERGDEVLYSAEASYPNEMKILIPKLADLVREGKISTISGGELLQFLRAVGLRVSVQTSISVEDHGKFVSLSDKLREKTRV